MAGIRKDLVKQLEDPFQIALVAAHTELAARPFSVGVAHVVSAGEFYRTEVTLESYAELTGVSATAIRREQAEVLRQVRKLKAGLEQRELPRKRRKKKH